MADRSAGILLYRRGEQGLEVFIAHPGGPFYAKRDEGVWSIPKGEYDEDEDALAAARREFREEIGQEARGEGVELSPIRLKSGKVVRAWAVEGDADASSVTSNTCPIEWPPRSGKKIEIPEIDRALWCSPEEAKRKLHPPQIAFIDELIERLGL